jgi:hypothetical protein
MPAEVWIAGYPANVDATFYDADVTVVNDASGGGSDVIYQFPRSPAVRVS